MDGVFSSETFEHIFNLEEIIKEINRVLKKEGLLLATCPFLWPEHEVPYDYARYTSFAMKNLLEKKWIRNYHIRKNRQFLYWCTSNAGFVLIFFYQ